MRIVIIWFVVLLTFKSYAKDCIDLSKHPNYHLLPQDCGHGLNDSLTKRISNGNQTAHGAYPWMALITATKELNAGWLQEKKCTGTLITEWYVLTAASCFVFEGINSMVTVWLRIYQHDKLDVINCDLKNCALPPLNFLGDTVKIDSNYQKTQYRENVAFVKLRMKVQFEEYIKPICLPVSCDFRTFDFVGSIGLLLGWDHKGAERTGLWKDALEKSLMLVVNKNTCQKDWGEDLNITDTMMCAGWPNNRGACEHDVGGPLLTETHSDQGSRWYQIGIVYDGICDKNSSVVDRVTVFTKVGDYMPYILENIGE